MSKKHNRERRKSMTVMGSISSQQCSGARDSALSVFQTLSSAGNGQQLKIAAQRCTRERWSGGGVKGVAVVLFICGEVETASKVVIIRRPLESVTFQQVTLCEE